VVIKGVNMGRFPRGAKISIGSKEMVPIKWQDNEIWAKIPAEAESGDLTVYNGFRSSRWNGPITIYDNATKASVEVISNRIKITNGERVSKVKVWDEKGNITEIPYEATKKEILAPINKIAWIVLLDSEDNIVKYWRRDLGE
jgi:WD40 repeat protein